MKEKAQEKYCFKEAFGKSTNIQCPGPCCDTCQEEIRQLVDKKMEFSVLTMNSGFGSKLMSFMTIQYHNHTCNMIELQLLL